MCRVNMFCCGCNLRSGAITALVLTGIGALSHFVYGVLHTTVDISGRHDLSQKEIKVVETVINAIAITHIIIGIVLVVVFVCLLIAILKHNADLVMPWLITYMIVIVLNCLAGILLLAFSNFGVIVLFGIIAFQIYLWIVVLSYYQDLKQGGTGTGIHPMIITQPVNPQPVVYSGYPSQPAVYPNQPMQPSNQPLVYPTQPTFYQPQEKV